MKKTLKNTLSPLLGALYAALAVLLSRLLIRNLSGLFLWVGPMAGLDEGTLSYGAQVLAQLQSAQILSPWLPCLLIGAAAAALAAWLISRRRLKRITIDLLVWILLLIPLALIVLWFTTVNSIRVSSLISLLIDLLPHLL